MAKNDYSIKIEANNSTQIPVSQWNQCKSDSTDPVAVRDHNAKNIQAFLMEQSRLQRRPTTAEEEQQLQDQILNNPNMPKDFMSMLKYMGITEEDCRRLLKPTQMAEQQMQEEDYGEEYVDEAGTVY